MQIKIRSKLGKGKNPVDQVLKSRGVDREWLEADERYFEDGSIMHNFQRAEVMVSNYALVNTKKIGILVDNDLDGFCSASIMYLWLKDINPNLEITPIIAEGKVHGIIDSLVPDDIELLITPDASSSEGEKHKKLYDRGIKVLVLDHHEIMNYDTPACVVNPHHKDCPYPNKDLSGAGVVYKFIEAYDKQHGLSYHKKYLDLAAAATVGDVMSLKSMENKAIINLGLNNIQNKYFQTYLKADQRVKDKEVNPILISFYLAPQINALIRVGTLEEKVELFEAMTLQTQPEPVIANITKLKGQQDRKKDGVLPRIVHTLQKREQDSGNIIIAEAPSTLPRPMTGLVCGKLAGMYKKPVLLGRKDGEGNLVGSFRSLNESNIENLKDFCEESKMFNWVAGHQAAAGFSIPLENIDKFLDYARENLPEFEAVLTVDFKIEGEPDEQGQLIRDLVELDNHIGCDISEIKLYSEIALSPEDFQIIGQKSNTLKIYKNGITYIKFRTPDFEIPSTIQRVKIVGTPNLNHWNGAVLPQILIKEMEMEDFQV